MQKRRKGMAAAILSAALVCSAAPFPMTDVSAAAGSGQEAITLTDSLVLDGTVQTDSETLLEGYVSQVMGLSSRAMLFANWGETVLNEQENLIYSQLKEKIATIASAGGSTQIALSQGNSFTFTYADLGISGDPTSLTQEMQNAISQRVETSFKKIMGALLVDCPYELYWYDKTTRSQYGYSYSWGNGNVTCSISQITFAVAQSYRQAGDQNRVDASKAAAAGQAAAKAQEIVEKYRAASDYEKLAGYKQEICNLTSYNHEAAAGNGVAYGDPWQLVYVFDGDTSTNVVCEGYAKAFQYLCDLTQFSDASVVCYTVTGIMGGGTGAGGHMWNIVTMPDGKNYLVDITNSDDGTVGQAGGLFLAGTAGTVADGYSFTAGGAQISFQYDEETKSLYGSGSGTVLELATAGYDPSTAVAELSAYPASVQAEYGTSFAVNVTGDSSKSVEIYLGSQKIADPVSLSGGSTQITVSTLTAGLSPAASADQTGSFSKDYTLTVKYTDGGSESVDISISVDYAEISGAAIPQQSANAAGWYNTSLQISAPTGYKVARLSDSAFPDANTVWGNVFSIDEEGRDISVVYYLQAESDGSISRHSASYSIDKTPPQGLSAQTAAESDASASVTLTAQDVLSGIKDYQLQYKSGGSAAPTIEVRGNGGFSVTGLEPLTDYVFAASASDQADNVSGAVDVRISTSGNQGPVIQFNPAYDPSKVYDGIAISAPAAENIEISGAEYQDVTFSWYRETVSEANKLESAPLDAGTYILAASVAGADNTTVASAQLEITILPADSDVGVVSYEGGTLYTSASWQDVILTSTGTTPGTLTLNQAVLEAGTREYAWTFVPQDTVNYKTVSGSVTLTVQELEAERIEVTGTPAKTEYAYGDSFAAEGMEVTVYYVDGSSRVLQPSEMQFQYANGTAFSVGDTSVTVSYTINGKSFTVGVQGLTVSSKAVADPQIVLGVPAGGYVYDGTEKRPNIALYDGSVLIPVTEYTVEYSNNIAAGQASVVIRDNAGGNYVISEKTVTFNIAEAQVQQPNPPQGQANAVSQNPGTDVSAEAGKTVSTGDADGYLLWLLAVAASGISAICIFKRRKIER